MATFLTSLSPPLSSSKKGIIEAKQTMLSRLLPATGIVRGRRGKPVSVTLTGLGTTSSIISDSSSHQCLSSISGNGGGGESESSNKSEDMHYDSQSGMWIPIHDESRISVFWRSACACPCTSSTDASGSCTSSDFIKSVRDAITKAHHDMDSVVAGSILTCHQCRYDALASSDDDDNVLSSCILKLASDLASSDKESSLPSSVSTGSKIFLPAPTAAPSLGSTIRPADELLAAADGINLVFEYKGDDIALEELQSTKRGLAHAQSLRPGRTSIGLFDAAIYNEQDPVLVANGVASLIDDTGGGSYVLLCPNDDVDVDDEDDIVALCEEMSYLDVAGPTMKSRLVVSAVSDDQVEECLGIGVSKYVVGDASALDRLQAVVEEQGKQLVSRS